MNNTSKTLRKRTSTAELLKIMCVFCMLAVFGICTAMVACADGSAASGVKSIYDYIVDITKVAGSLMALFGIIQIGVSIAQTHDASQRMTGILLAAGGAIRNCA